MSAAYKRWHDRQAEISTSIRWGLLRAGPQNGRRRTITNMRLSTMPDWAAVDNILAMKNITPQMHSPEEFQRLRNHQANGMGGLPLVGDPDLVSRDMERLAALGLKGIAVSFLNYLDELPYFCAEVLPRLARLGLRDTKIRVTN